MIDIKIFSQIIQYVEKSCIDIKPQFNDQGELLGYRIKSLNDPKYCVAYSDAERGVWYLKEYLVKKMVKDFEAGEQMPF